MKGEAGAVNNSVICLWQRQITFGARYRVTAYCAESFV